jgi:hypothetical protein
MCLLKLINSLGRKENMTLERAIKAVRRELDREVKLARHPMDFCVAIDNKRGFNDMVEAGNEKYLLAICESYGYPVTQVNASEVNRENSANG